MTTMEHAIAEAVEVLSHRYGDTLSAVLRHRAGSDTDKPAIRFVDYAVERGGVERVLTFAELDARVTAVAATIAAQCNRGDRVAVLTAQGLEFVVGFLAALRAGTVAVPLFSPDLPGHGDRLRTVLDDCAPALALATSTNETLVAEFVTGVPVLVVDRVPDTAGGSWQPPSVGVDDVAYLQYTSGSTRAPAGVEITHGNVVSNAAQPLVAADARPEDTLVSWLPLFHDMGLVFVVGGSLVGGMTAVLMDPIAFLMKPQRWLAHLAGNPGAFSPAPNFAFDFCAKRIPEAERAAFDLSGVRALFNGAEPIAPKTLTAFYDAFAAAGFGRGRIAPSYGLAEATVFVTSELPSDLPQSRSFDLEALTRGRVEDPRPGERSVELVACGVVAAGAIAIADPGTGTRVAEGGVGEIWVNTPSVGVGYWNKPELTAQVFGQVLLEAGDLPGSGWLRTGDLGAIVDGRLYVTGRIKDLLIVDGRNHYPHDLERTVEDAHAVVGRHRTAAFSIATPDGEQGIVVAEVSRHHVDGDWTPAEVSRALVGAVSREHGLKLRDVVLIAPDTVPRTTSGKIARQASRTAYLEGTLQVLRPEA